jgi:hypothetical protein
VCRIDEEAKGKLLRGRNRWTGDRTISTQDLPWLLSEWLPENCLGVPADAQSGSQDLFLRLSGGVVGFALKAVGASSGTDWNDLQEELGKAPALPAKLPYTLVLWSLHLSPGIREVLGDASSIPYKEGQWYLRGGMLQKGIPTTDADGYVFSVAASQELVIANPHAPGGGGLRELLGSDMFQLLRSVTSTAGMSEIAHLTKWMINIDRDASTLVPKPAASAL